MPDGHRPVTFVIGRRDWLIHLIGIASTLFFLLVILSKAQGEYFFLNLSNKRYFYGSKKNAYLHELFDEDSDSFTNFSYLFVSVVNIPELFGNNVCDPHCAAGCKVHGNFTCDGLCGQGYTNVTNFTCQGKAF